MQPNMSNPNLNLNLKSANEIDADEEYEQLKMLEAMQFDNDDE